MIIRLLVAMSGDRAYAAGDPYECDDASAQRLIAAGRAVPWRVEEVERAVTQPPETAAPTPRRSRK